MQMTSIAAQELSADELKFFESKIRPVLIKECYGCHSVKTGATKGGLMVDTKEALLLGGDSGAAIVPGDLDESLLWSAINHEDYNMPPGKMMSDKVIADFKTWIEMGAPDPRVIKITEIKSEITPEDVEKGREFWAFRKPISPAIPESKNERWAETDIDRLVLAKLEENELKPSKDADAETVLRRLTFNLTGLPPTPRQIDWMKKNFEREPRVAVSKVVDELLESDQYGERWGRHWLDIARYGESTGREVNITFPNAWRYRDYVIDSFNDDKPYDQFVQEQIAGDLLPVNNDEKWSENLVATGFLALGPKTLTEQNGRQFRLDLIDEQVDVTSRAILGVSVACARCHDHKFDPIPQTDYYAMSGIFENTSTRYGTIDTLQNRRPSNLIMLPVADPEVAKQKISRKQLQDLKEQLEETQAKFREATRARQQMRKGGSSSGAQKSLLSVARLSSQSAALKAKIVRCRI
jgi:cytochrome c553